MATTIVGLEDLLNEVREMKVALICLCNLMAEYAEDQNGSHEYYKIFNEYFEATDGKAK